MATIEIKLLVDLAGEKPVYEMVPSEQIGANHFRISSSPGFVPGIASGDEIELNPSEKSGYRVLRRSGNICIQLFLNHCNPQQRMQITDIIRSINGWLDGGKSGSGTQSGCLLIFTIPVVTGFKAIERAMSQIEEGFDVDRWMYGNVYDTSDGKTPLQWWK